MAATEPPALAVEFFQEPSALEDAALSANARRGRDAPEEQLRHGELISPAEAMFGLPFEVGSWRWSHVPADKNGPPTVRTNLVPSLSPRRSAPLLDPKRILADTVWEGQGTRDVLIEHPNALPARWPPRWRPSAEFGPIDREPSPRFVAVEELTGRVDEIEGDSIACSVWRRGLEHDQFSAHLKRVEFNESDRAGLEEGDIFYWTLGELYIPGLDSYAVSRLMRKRPTPDEVLDRLYEAALRAEHAKRPRTT